MNNKRLKIERTSVNGLKTDSKSVHCAKELSVNCTTKVSSARMFSDESLELTKTFKLDTQRQTQINISEY